MKIKPETLLKANILSRGINFTLEAMNEANVQFAKRQNLIYNAPACFSAIRPQELFLKNMNDGYETVVSCVSPHSGNALELSVDPKSHKLIISNEKDAYQEVEIRYVPEPSYYRQKLSDDIACKDYVSACGWDELNIIPWKGCALNKCCLFCGANNFIDQNGMNAFQLSHHPDSWFEHEEQYLNNLYASIKIALQDECYRDHFHAILISGNLEDSLLDFQTEIYSRISSHIKELLKESKEGLVAVITPPNSITDLPLLKSGGIDIVVFNLEVSRDPWFSRYCPGKKQLGEHFFEKRLYESIDIWGTNHVWSNFVLGLEPIDLLLESCKDFAQQGIVPGANVLHLDLGNRLNVVPPTVDEITSFYHRLSLIYKDCEMQPYYCSKALRTSLSNEAFDNRISD